MKVVATDGLAREGIELLQKAPGLEVEARPRFGEAQLRRALRAAEALIVRSATRVTAELLEAAPRLRVIGRAGIGYDNIDTQAATRRGVVVMNTPAGSHVTTAEHTLSLMMALARRIPQATASIKAGRWERQRFVGMELQGKTLGLIGLGNVGTAVAERAKALKMEVLAYDPYITEERAAKLGVELVGLGSLYRRSHII
ncbi:MAG: phosphoglycerate dehydrogenase, partial [Deltaproteobacteria bacterium]|nr:phosphoglycerate dehydrogenase [Deltaproteobacteria bacterium]